MEIAALCLTSLFAVFKFILILMIYRKLGSIEHSTKYIINFIGLNNYEELKTLATRKRGANRYPRTNEQKKSASEKKKEWWAKKRESENSKVSDSLGAKQA